MLILWRRHVKDCPHREKGREYLKCQCPIWMDWRTDGPRIRRPVGTRNWQVAQRKAREWEAQGFAGGGKTTTIQEATEKFIEDAKARNLREATLYKYDLLFRQLKAFADEHGLVFISDFNLDWARNFRATWLNKNLAAKKKLEHLRAFFRFAYESNWMDSNPAAKLKPPMITESPTLPFSMEEMGRVLEACNEYPDKRNAVRLRALVLLLRYSGLRFTDAAKLSRDRITGDNLLLYTAKTGTPVNCPLPPVLIDALAAIPEDGPYYFWTGKSATKGLAGSIWWRPLHRLFALAKVPNGHAHRFRDTFAVELLLAGVPIDRVSVLLGHKSVRITERHYAPWVRSRQEQLEADVRRTWDVAIRRRARLGHTREKRVVSH